MRRMMQDLRFSSRVLQKSAGFTVLACLSLALGIAANTTIFSVVNAVLLRPLPFEDAARLISVMEGNPRRRSEPFPASYPNLLDWQAKNQSFEQMAGARFEEATLSGGAEPERVAALSASWNFLATLRVQPVIGRGFLAADDHSGAQRVALVSESLWRRRFQGDPNLLGRDVILDGENFTVVGIVPAMPDPLDGVQVWTPLGRHAAEMQNRAVHYIYTIARLRSGKSLDDARNDMARVTAEIQRQYPEADRNNKVVLLPLQESLVGNSQRLLLVLWGAVGLVLLIACGNVGGLLLARGAARRREIAIRISLGATRLDLFRLVFTEGLLLAVLGGVAGLLLSLWCVESLRASLLEMLPRANEIRLDGWVLSFTAGISVFCGLLLGLAPAFEAGRTDLSQALQEKGTLLGWWGQGRHFRSFLVAAETGLSLVLLIGAGLLIKSFWTLTRVDPGFQPAQLLTFRVALPSTKYRTVPPVVAFFRELPARLEAVPGVRMASAVNVLPISGGESHGNLTVENRPFPPGESARASYRRVLPNYFRTMGIPLREGREFGDSDHGQDPKVVLISHAMARRFWPGESPLGQRIKVGPPAQEPWLTIVGVVGDVKNIGLDTDAGFATYEPHAQRAWDVMRVVVRTEGNPAGVAASVRAALRAVEPELVVDQERTMEQRLALSVGQPRIQTFLLGGFAFTALLLALIGLYGLMAYTVNQRTREIGVRMALGANRADVLSMVLRQGMALGGMGMVVGLLASWGLARFLSGLLFEVQPTDLSSFLLIPVLQGAVAFLACWLPARRAAAVDPMHALRYE